MFIKLNCLLVAIFGLLGLVQPLNAQPASTDLGTLQDISPTYATEDYNSTAALAAGQVRWIRFTLNTAVNNAAGLFLDFDTTATGITDTEIGLYDSLGNLITSDDDDGPGNFSALTYGQTTPTRGPIGTGLAANGRDGGLAAGLYYLAIAEFNTTFGATAWTVTTTGTGTGTTTIFVRTNIPAPVGDPEINLEQPVGTTVASSSSMNVGTQTLSVQFVRTFTVRNQGATQNLNVTSISAAPTGVMNCTVSTTALAPASPVAPSGTATFDLQVTPTGTPFQCTLTILSNDVDEGTYTVIITGTTPPPNDTVAGSVVLALNRSVAGTLNSATNDYQIQAASTRFSGLSQTTNTAPGRDVAYSFTAPANGNYTFRTHFGTVSNQVVYLLSVAPTGTAPITINDADIIAASNRNNFTSNVGESVFNVSLTATQLVYFIVDEVTLTAGGNFVVEVTNTILETEPNGTPATAGFFTSGMEHSLGTAGDLEFFSLGTPITGSRVFAMTDTSGGGDGTTLGQDSVIRVTTTTNTLEYDDDDGDSPYGNTGSTTSRSSMIAGCPTTGVQTFLEVSYFGAGATLTEPWRVYAVVQPPIASATTEAEPNDTTPQANAAPNNYFSGTLSTAGDIDLYSFYAAAGDEIFLGLDLDPTRTNLPINGALALLDSTGAVVISVNDGNTTSSITAGATLTSTTPNSPAEGIVFRAMTGGIYYSRVTYSSGTVGRAYLLSISKNGQIGGGASVNSYNIDFGNALGTPTSALGAAANQGGNWQQINGFAAVTPVALSNMFGTATAVTIAPSAIISAVSFNNATTSGDDERLLDDFLDGARTYTISGLPAGNYEVYVYGWAPDSASFVTGINVNGLGVQNAGGTFNGYVQGTTHSRHTVTLAAAQNITIVTTVVSGFASTNGIQIKELPAVLPPTVTALNPTSGATTGGNSVVITGTNFTGATGVNFGATPATSFTVDTPTQITATAPAHAAGVVDVTVNAPGGTSSNTSSDNYTYIAPPSVTINQAGAQADPTNASPIQFTVVFSEAVTGFDSTDITLGGTAGATTAVVSGTGANYTVDVSGMTGPGTVIASIAAGVCTSTATTQPNTASTSTDNTVTFDNVAPTVTCDQDGAQADPTNGATINFAVVFSESVTGFTNANVDTSASTATGTLTAVVTGSGTTYNVAISGMTGSGDVVCSVTAGAATDAAGNASVASTSTDSTVTYDVTVPTVTIEQGSTQNDPTNASPITFDVVFSETVTGFDSTDVALSGTVGGTLVANVSGSGTTYTVTVTGMSGVGTVIADVNAGGATDAAGNTNAASTSVDKTVNFDDVAPTVSCEQAAAQADPTGLPPINFTVTFNESVSGFTNTDVTITGTAGGTKTAVVTGGPAVYNVAISGMTTIGTVIVSVPAGGAVDAAGNTNAASSSLDNTVNWDPALGGPTVTIEQGATQADPSMGGASIIFDVVFSAAVTGFATGDVTLGGTAGGTLIGTVAGTGTTYTVTVTGMTTTGTVIASIAAGVCQDGSSNVNQASTSVDNTVTWNAPAPDINIQRASSNVADGTSDNIGTVPFGIAQTATYTIQNTGNAGLTITASPALVNIVGTPGNCTANVTTQPSSSSIAAAGSLTFVITYTVTTAAAFNFDVQIVSNDPDAESTYDFQVIGTGGSVPEINVTRGVAIADGGTDTLGNVNVSSNTTFTYTIQNLGNSNLTLTLPIVISGATNCTATVTTPPASATVAAAGNQTFVVTVTPTAAGSFGFTVTVTSDDADEGTYNWTASGTGTTTGGGGGGGGGKDGGGCSTGENNSLWMLAGVMAALGLALRLRRKLA